MSEPVAGPEAVESVEEKGEGEGVMSLVVFLPVSKVTLFLAAGWSASAARARFPKLTANTPLPSELLDKVSRRGSNWA